MYLCLHINSIINKRKVIMSEWRKLAFLVLWMVVLFVLILLWENKQSNFVSGKLWITHGFQETLPATRTSMVQFLSNLRRTSRSRAGNKHTMLLRSSDKWRKWRLTAAAAQVAMPTPQANNSYIVCLPTFQMQFVTPA